MSDGLGADRELARTAALPDAVSVIRHDLHPSISPAAGIAVFRISTSAEERETSVHRGSGGIPKTGRVSKVAASTSLGGQFRCRRPKL
jgi:hypothetical protein